MGGGGNGCGSGLLVVTSNKLVTFPRWNSIRLSGGEWMDSCCSVWGMDGTAFAFQAHAAPSGEWMEKHSPFGLMLLRLGNVTTI